MTLKWLAAQHLALIYHHSNYSQHIQLDNRHLWYNANALSKHQQRPGVQTSGAGNTPNSGATLAVIPQPASSRERREWGRPYRGSTGRRLPRHQQPSPKTGQASLTASRCRTRRPVARSMPSVTTPKLSRGRRLAQCTRHRISSKLPALMKTQ